MAKTRSQELFERAQQLIAGGVNSPVRAVISYTHSDDIEMIQAARASFEVR